MAKQLSRQPLLFQLFVRFRENRPTKDYSCKISDGNSNSKCHLLTDYEMVALKTPHIFIILDIFEFALICLKEGREIVAYRIAKYQQFFCAVLPQFYLGKIFLDESITNPNLVSFIKKGDGTAAVIFEKNNMFHNTTY